MYEEKKKQFCTFSMSWFNPVTPHYVENMHHNNCPSLSCKFIISSLKCLSSLVILSYFSHRAPEGLLKGMMYVIHNNLFIRFFDWYFISHTNQQQNTVHVQINSVMHDGFTITKTSFFVDVCEALLLIMPWSFSHSMLFYCRITRVPTLPYSRRYVFLKL